VCGRKTEATQKNNDILNSLATASSKSTGDAAGISKKVVHPWHFGLGAVRHHDVAATPS